MLEGLSLERHFVLLYELLSLGNARLALLPTDCPRVMAALLLRALPVADWREVEIPKAGHELSDLPARPAAD